MFMASPTKAVVVPLIIRCKRFLIKTTRHPAPGPKKNPANKAGNSEMSKVKNVGAKGKGNVNAIKMAAKALNKAIKVNL